MYTHLFFQSSAMPEQPSFLLQLIPFALIFAIFWLLLIRPQRKRQQQHTDMLASLKRGDVVVTAGGLIGKVSKLNNDDELSLDVGEGIRLRVRKSMIVDKPSASASKPASVSASKETDPGTKD